MPKEIVYFEAKLKNNETILASFDYSEGCLDSRATIDIYHCYNQLENVSSEQIFNTIKKAEKKKIEFESISHVMQFFCGLETISFSILIKHNYNEYEYSITNNLNTSWCFFPPLKILNLPFFSNKYNLSTISWNKVDILRLDFSQENTYDYVTVCIGKSISLSSGIYKNIYKLDRKTALQLLNEGITLSALLSNVYNDTLYSTKDISLLNNCKISSASCKDEEYDDFSFYEFFFTDGGRLRFLNKVSSEKIDFFLTYDNKEFVDSLNHGEDATRIFLKECQKIEADENFSIICGIMYPESLKTVRDFIAHYVRLAKDDALENTLTNNGKVTFSYLKQQLDNYKNNFNKFYSAQILTAVNNELRKKTTQVFLSQYMRFNERYKTLSVNPEKYIDNVSDLTAHGEAGYVLRNNEKNIESLTYEGIINYAEQFANNTNISMAKNKFVSIIRQLCDIQFFAQKLFKKDKIYTLVNRKSEFSLMTVPLSALLITLPNYLAYRSKNNYSSFVISEKWLQNAAKFYREKWLYLYSQLLDIKAYYSCMPIVHNLITDLIYVLEDYEYSSMLQVITEAKHFSQNIKGILCDFTSKKVANGLVVSWLPPKHVYLMNCIEAMCNEMEFKRENIRLSERQAVLTEMAHTIKNLVESVITPLSELESELGDDLQQHVVVNAIAGTSLIRELAEGIHLSMTGEPGEWCDDIDSQGKDSMSLETILEQALSYAVPCMFRGKYFGVFVRNYFSGTPKELEYAKKAWNASCNLHKKIEVIKKYFMNIKIDVCKEIMCKRFGNKKGTAMKLIIIFQELFLNAFKYCSYVERERRYLNISLVMDNSKLNVHLENSCIADGRQDNPKGLGLKIIHAFECNFNTTFIFTSNQDPFMVDFSLNMNKK